MGDAPTTTAGPQGRSWRARRRAVRAAAAALEPGRSCRLLREALHDVDGRVRLAAAVALAPAGDPRALAILVGEGLGGSHAQRAAACDALAAAG